MYSLISLTFFVLTLSIWGSHVRGQTRIIGGKPAAQGMFPYHAFISITIAGNVYDYSHNDSSLATSSCGGSLISESFVITAAHCLKYRKPLYYNTNGTLEESLNETVIAECADLVLGKVNLTGTPKGAPRIAQPFLNLNRSNFIIHPSYYNSLGKNGTFPEIYNDIALIRLPTPAKFNAFIKPIQLPTAYLNNLMQGTATVVGFGWHNSPQAPNVLSIDNLLRYVNVDIISNVECRSTQKTKICIRGKRNNISVGTCVGDSGGPLIFKSNGVDVIVGIASHGSKKNCTDGYPKYFTRVTEYLDWINANMNV